MEEVMSCPVCGADNIRIYYTEEIGLVEDHYFCETCGYWEEMAYSPTYAGIEPFTKSPMAFLRQLRVLWKHRKNLHGLWFARNRF